MHFVRCRAETTRRPTPESISRKSPPSRLRGLGPVDPIRSLHGRLLGVYTRPCSTLLDCWTVWMVWVRSSWPSSDLPNPTRSAVFPVAAAAPQFDQIPPLAKMAQARVPNSCILLRGSHHSLVSPLPMRKSDMCRTVSLQPCHGLCHSHNKHKHKHNHGRVR